jgi:hypothetical protein
VTDRWTPAPESTEFTELRQMTKGGASAPPFA